MNEWYAKDTSQKVRVIFNAKMQEGKRVSPSVPYGYLRDPKDKQHLIIDPENDHCKSFTSPCTWSTAAVCYIPEKQEYMGHTVLGKTVLDSFKTKKRRMNG